MEGDRAEGVVEGTELLNAPPSFEADRFDCHLPIASRWGG